MKWQPPKMDDGEPCIACIPAQLCDLHKHLIDAGEFKAPKGPISIFNWGRAQKFLDAKKKGASDKRASARAGWSIEVYIKWKQEIVKGTCVPAIEHFIMFLVPEAETVWYERALGAIDDGLDDEDVHKAAKIGLEVIKVFFPDDHSPATQKHKHEVTGEAGGPIEFVIKFDDGPSSSPPKPAEEEEDE